MGALSSEIRGWLFDAALPFWTSHGVDRRRGGFFEALDDAGRPAETFRRTRVAARQVYVFAHAALLGFSDGRAIAEQGFEDLIAQAWLGPERGWARRLDVDGGVIDPTPDLYDMAFVLNAAGWLHRLNGDRSILDRAHETLDFIEARLRPPTGPGFHAAWPPTGPRLQNPHMHLLEAALAVFEASGDARFGALADSLAALFAEHLFDPATGTLAEHFAEDWTRIPGAPLEPGHHLEWAWLLAQHHRLRGRDLSAPALALHAFGERHGVDPVTGAVMNAVTETGAPLDPTSRTWPNTERLKAAVAVWTIAGRDPRADLHQSGRVLFDRFLAREPRGTWWDTLDPQGAPMGGLIPASTLYHLFLGFTEVLRVADALDL